MKKYKTGIILWISAILCTIIVFPNISLNPNSSLFNVSNDGIKNYFTTLFYINYDEGNHFSGMNYPFGEHVVFTDNMPVLARPLQFLGSYFPWIKTHTLGIVNLCLLFSIVLSVYYIFKILTHYKVNPIYAILSALFVAFLSPQLNRITAHYGMGIIFYIPATIYYIIQYTHTSKKSNLLYIFIIITISVFFHLYNLAIVFIFSGFYVFWLLIFNKFSRNSIRQSVWLFTVFVTSLIFSYGFITLTDHVKDRPRQPYEALANEATLKDILTNDVPLGHVLQFLTGSASPVISSEGKSYIGLVSILILLSLIIYFLQKLFRKKQGPSDEITGFTQSYRVFLAAAFCQLLFSMAIPFIFDRDFFIDRVSVFRHFRALGRFIWPFYYVIMIYCFVITFKIFLIIRSRMRPKLAYSFLVIVMLIWLVQYSAYYTAFRNYDKNALTNYQNLYSKNEKNWQQWLSEKGYRTSDLQAVFGLPFFHASSEKIWIGQGNVGMNEYELCKLSLQTGIPVINNLMARTSWGQTFDIIQLLDGPFNKKAVLKYFDERPILVYHEKKVALDQVREKEWIEQAKFLGSWNDEIDIYAINPKHLQSINEGLRDSIRQVVETDQKTSGMITADNTPFYYENSFTKTNNLKGFADNGMLLAAADKEFVIVDSIMIPESAKGKAYTLSIWAKCNMKDFRTPYFELHQFDRLGKQVSVIFIHTKESTNVIEDWFKAATNFDIDTTTNYMILKAYGGWDKPVYTGLDNLLIQPIQGIHFYKSPLRGLLLNNRPQ